MPPEFICRNCKKTYTIRIKVCCGGQKGTIIVRQRGAHYFPKNNVDMGKDHAIFALIDDGIVVFKKLKTTEFLLVFSGSRIV